MIEDEQAKPEVIEAFAPYTRALGRPVDSPNGRAMLELLGDSPVVTEFVVGVPAVVERYLSFPCGAEVLLRDGVMAAIWFHREPSAAAPAGFEMDRLLPGLATIASREEAAALLGKPRRASWGIKTEGFAIRDDTLSVHWVDADDVARDPGRRTGVDDLMIRPREIDRALKTLEMRCPACADLVARDCDGHMDLDATLEELAAAVDARRLRNDAYFVPVGDVLDLRASGLLDRIETHLDCSTCRTTWCLVVPKVGEATFVNVAGFAYDHPKPAVPPVELWAGEERRARERAAMKVLYADGGSFFLLQKGDELYLDARYTMGAAFDGSALVRLTAGERAEYERLGITYVGRLQHTIENSAPWSQESPWYARDLKRQPAEKEVCAEVSPAIGAWRRERAWQAKEQG